MNADTQITLGAITFARFEVPEHIEFGGEQALAVHELVGGKRIIDAMGRRDQALSWGGQFIGENAEQRANYLNYVRIAGKPLELAWASFRYNVLVRSALLDYRRKYEISYRISCEVVEDVSVPFISAASDSIDTAVAQDMAAANTLGGQIGDGPLSTALSTLGSAISAVSSFANAAQSTINSVLAPIAAVQAQVATLIASTGNTIANIATVGGVLPNNPIAVAAANLTRQVNGYAQLPTLLNLQAVVGRMSSNLGSVAGSAKSLTTAGGNLFTLASQAYGDVAAWATIARANKLTDPAIAGVQTIRIPITPDSSGGVYGN